MATYQVYVRGKTGVNKSAGSFQHKMVSTKPDMVVHSLPESPSLFVTITAKSSEAESNIATAIKFIPRK